MLPDRVSNPGPLTYESGAYRLRYAARLVLCDESLMKQDDQLETVSDAFHDHRIETTIPDIP